MIVCPTGSETEGIISLDDISEVRVGHGTDVFNSVTKDKKVDTLTNFDVGTGKKVDITRNHCFSIIFKGNERPLDLVSDNIANRNFWVIFQCSYIDFVLSTEKQNKTRKQ